MSDEPYDLKDREYLFYTPDSYLPQQALSIPQGPGSGLDADTIQGIQAVTAAVAGPNKLVATGSNGKLPSVILPASSSSGIISSRDGTKTYQLLVEANGALSFDRLT